MKAHFIGICGVILAAACCAARADDIPPPEAGDVQVNSRLISGQLEIRDARNGVAIVVPKAQILSGFPSSIETSIDLRAQPTGADIVVTAHNTSNAAATLGSISAGIINLGLNIESFDFRATSEPMHLEWSSYTASAWLYPDDLYSPVFVLRNGTYAVGISIQYPLMDYKHDVALSLNNPRGPLMDGEGGPGWLAMFWLGNPLNHMAARWASLAPGETRTYVVSVRVSRDPQEWQTTLLPYRDFFRSRYGGVKYTRDTAPILSLALSDQAWVGASNPYGFAASLRPDLNGWGPVRTNLMGEFSTWPTIMLWSASGMARNHPERNYPYQFTTHWNATPRLAEVYNTTNGLPSVVASGKKLGLWWGRAAEVSTEWDSANFEPFDPDIPAHVQAAYAEMDGAVHAGATMVGLDTFMPYLTPVWKQYPWIQQLEQRYPTVKFSLETSSCDIMHTIAASFVPGWQTFSSRPPSINDLIIIRHANYLADLINPGHETWGQLSYQEQTHWFGSRPSSAQVHADMTNFATYGYRPVVAATVTYIPGVDAATTWESSLPGAIRDSDPYIADIRAGRLPGVAAEGANPPPQGAPPPPTPPGTDEPPPVVPPSSEPSGSSNVRTFRPAGIFGLGVRKGPSPPPSSPSQNSPVMIFHMRKLRIEKIKTPQGIISHYIAKAPQAQGGPDQ